MEDTIAAIATASGEGGIGIVRISGNGALSILKDIFIPHYEGNQSFENRKLTFGKIYDDEKKEMIDEVLAVYMKAPNTYTCEDVVEINCHGSMISLRKTLSLVLRKGARIAEKGEFTKRAFLNGRLDLSQAEAVIDMISAKTDVAYDVAMGQLEGQLSKKISQIRSDLMEVLVQITVNIDYPDEDIEEISYEKMDEELRLIQDKVEILLKSKDTGKVIKEGLDTVIIGKPNVGKSSLMNLLLRESRSIVTDIPGTTRDTIEEMMSLKGAYLKITDTAGIRETDDVVEKIGVKKSEDSFERADLVIFIIDGSQQLEKEDLSIMKRLKEKKSIILLNKTDLKQCISVDHIREYLPDQKIIETSMALEQGITQIEEEIEKMIYYGNVRQNESILITNMRHFSLLEDAKKSLNDSIECIERREALEIVEIDVRNAWESLGKIIGKEVEEDIIDEVFSRFCLGK